MNKNQFLLLKLAEECAEVAHVAMKQIQFGKNNIRKDKTDTNTERLKDEVMDLFAMVTLLIKAEEIPFIWDDEMAEARARKVEKMQKYLDQSFKLGQLPEIKL
jgi:NTP pyrophosphatase (non-canonical NTP hydrolase)